MPLSPYPLFLAVALQHIYFTLVPNHSVSRSRFSLQIPPTGSTLRPAQSQILQFGGGQRDENPKSWMGRYAQRRSLLGEEGSGAFCVAQMGLLSSGWVAPRSLLSHVYLHYLLEVCNKLHSQVLCGNQRLMNVRWQGRGEDSCRSDCHRPSCQWELA